MATLSQQCCRVPSSGTPIYRGDLLGTGTFLVGTGKNLIHGSFPNVNGSRCSKKNIKIVNNACNCIRLLKSQTILTILQDLIH